MNVVSIAEIIISHPSFFVGITAHTMLIMDVIVKNISICLSSSFCIYVFYDDFMGIFLVLGFCDIYHVEHSCFTELSALRSTAHAPGLIDHEVIIPDCGKFASSNATTRRKHE